MSIYIHFFIRGDKRFYPVASFCGGSVIYKLFHDVCEAPWEKIKAVTSSNLFVVRTAANARIDELEDEIKKHESIIESVGLFSNSVDDKIEAIMSEKDYIEELIQEIEELKYCKSFSSFLDEMIMGTGDKDYKTEDICPDKYIYVGIEMPCPTEEDIVEE